MNYNRLGNTGMEASIIGFGAEHLDGKEYEIVKETVDAAMEHGINLMDLFMPGHDIRQKLGRAIKGNRDKFIIQGHICSTDINEQYDDSRDLDIVKKYFEDLYIDLDTDYIDLGMLFRIDDEQLFDSVFNTGIVRYAEDLKKSGRIRAIGASTHDIGIAKKIIETGIVEVLMYCINPAFDMIPAKIVATDYLDNEFDTVTMTRLDPVRQDLYRECASLDIPIVVMKTLGGGKLVDPEQTPFSKPLTVHECIHYALSRPGVASALVGCQSRQQIEEAASYLDADIDSLDYTEVIHSMGESFTGSCVYCNHCLPCPAGIDIAAVTKCVDMALRGDAASKSAAAKNYQSLAAHGSDCIRCGSCESRCPFSVPTMNNMEQAAGIFGK